MELNIGKNLKRLRSTKGITQEQLSSVMNVSCASVSKWERGETYPDITLLQPLAFYFGVTVDELMGYDENKIQERIDEIILNYRNCRDADEAGKIIADGYREFPNDYGIMYCYMYEMIGGCADNAPDVLLCAKETLRTICDKILSGCMDIDYRLGAWDVLAKILHAEGKTDEALSIYKEYFPNWYNSGEQKSEQLFAKDTDEYYFRTRKNMYELADFSADKLGRTVFFAPDNSLEEKTNRAVKYGEILINSYKETDDAFFLVVAESFLGRMENDLSFRGGTDEQVIAIADLHLTVLKELGEKMKGMPPLFSAYDNRPEFQENVLEWQIDYLLRAPSKRRAELLQNPDYLQVLNKYR